MTATAASPGLDPARLKGVLLVLVAATVWSSGGPLMRAIEQATPWQILFWRSAAMFVVIALHALLVLKVEVRSAARGFGGLGWLSAAFVAGAFSLSIVALEHTTVANTLFMVAVSPLVAAVLGGILLKESVRRATWFALSLAAVGLAVMLWEGFDAGSPLGNLAAMGSAASFALFNVIYRRAELIGRKLDMSLVLCAGALIGVTVSGVTALAEGTGLLLSTPDLLYSLAFGLFQVGLGFILFTAGAKYLTAAEATLLALLEVVLAPTWTWLIFQEEPSELGLIGGLILLAAMILQAASGMRRRRQPAGIVA
jgi:DME family drug/metabolite transporter